MKLEITEIEMQDLIESVEGELSRWRRSAIADHVPNTIASLTALLSKLESAYNRREE